MIVSFSSSSTNHDPPDSESAAILAQGSINGSDWPRRRPCVSLRTPSSDCGELATQPPHLDMPPKDSDGDRPRSPDGRDEAGNGSASRTNPILGTGTSDGSDGTGPVTNQDVPAPVADAAAPLDVQ